MTFILLAACAAPETPVDANPEPERAYELRLARACALIAEDSPAKPSRLVFLHKGPGSGVEAQAELMWFEWSNLRCAPVRLYVEPKTDGNRFTFDYIPTHANVTIAELRLYADHDGWTPNDPYVVATYDPKPFQDYVFVIDLATTPAADPSAMFLP